METKTFIFLIIVHFLADFGLQTHDQAINKSTSNKYLAFHVGIYSMVWFIAMWGYTGLWNLALYFAVITFVAHFITDYITSRISKKFFGVNDFHNGFVTVGFDQVLHYLQLIVTFNWLVSILK